MVSKKRTKILRSLKMSAIKMKCQNLITTRTISKIQNQDLILLNANKTSKIFLQTFLNDGGYPYSSR